MSEAWLELEAKTASAAATRRLAATLGKALAPPAVIALHGDLGAGKTTFVQGLVAGLPGGRGLRVQSPTYALARTYATTPPVHHLDLYRLEDEGAALDLGLGELLLDPEALACVEWPERASGLLPARTLAVTLSGSGSRRRVRVRCPPELLREPSALARDIAEAGSGHRKKG